MIRAVIFDLDGVLVSTDELHYKAWQRLASELGINNFSKEDNIRQRGVSRMESLNVVLEKSSISYSEDEKLELAERKNKYYIEMLSRLDENAVLPGVMKTLHMLKDKKILIAVGSASKNTPMILERTKLYDYIDKISCGLDVTKSKPDPEVFLVAAKKLQIPACECLVVEDSAAGVVAAKRADMKSLGVGENFMLLNADYEAINLDASIPWDNILGK